PAKIGGPPPHKTAGPIDPSARSGDRIRREGPGSLQGPCRSVGARQRLRGIRTIQPGRILSSGLHRPVPVGTNSPTVQAGTRTPVENRGDANEDAWARYGRIHSRVDGPPIVVWEPGSRKRELPSSGRRDAALL